MPRLTLTALDYTGGFSTVAIARNTYPDAILAYSVTHMVDEILERMSRVPSRGSNDPVVIELLRICGHAAPGIQGMGDSQNGSANLAENNRRQIIAVDQHGYLLNRGALVRLRGCFDNRSVVELHGCFIAQGPAGARLLRALSDLWGGVTVRGGINSQRMSTVGLD